MRGRPARGSTSTAPSGSGPLPRLGSAQLVDGVDRADSWATDAHKWLNVPYDCGLVFCGTRRRTRRSMAVAASYLQRADGPSPSDWYPSRPGAHAASPSGRLSRSLGAGRRRARRPLLRPRTPLRELLGAEPGVEVLNDVVLNQVLVRFGDAARRRGVVAACPGRRDLLARRHGLAGPAAMRISVSNFRTTSEDVDRSAAAILEAAAAVSGTLR